MHIVIIGGGAAGFFAAIAAKEANPMAQVTILEQSAKLLSKVKISGGGRCNVTHACFDPKQLVLNYPRGQKELLGPFHVFQPRDTIHWFQNRGVILKQEEDGRMFPISNTSSTIIGCLLNEAQKLGINISTLSKLRAIRKIDDKFELLTNASIAETKATTLTPHSPIIADRVILATGNNPAGWSFAESLGHTIQPPVPSLFTFNIPSFSLVDLAGVSVDQAHLRIDQNKTKDNNKDNTEDNTKDKNKNTTKDKSKLEQTGPLLITHWGFSGPAALKLSAWGARLLAEKNYEVTLIIDWLPSFSEKTIREHIEQERQTHPTKHVRTLRMFSLPKKLWIRFCDRAGLAEDLALNRLTKEALNSLCNSLKDDRYTVSGKTTNKEEFVTCGGVTLSEVNFKTMESKCCKNLFFCGEVLDIDGVTGGFNFQNAWTTGWIAGNSVSSQLNE